MSEPGPPSPQALAHGATRMTGRDPNELHRAATPLELLFDLTFVVGFGVAAEQLAHLLAEGHLASGLIGSGFAMFAVLGAGQLLLVRLGLRHRYGLLAIIALGEVVIGTVASLAAVVQRQGWTLDAVLVGVAEDRADLRHAVGLLPHPVSQHPAGPPRAGLPLGYGHMLIFAAPRPRR
jgi:low temperature requirement protein LtrA